MSITVYAAGSCNNKTRVGSSRVMVQYSHARTFTDYSYQNTTAMRSTLQGLIDGVSQLQESGHVLLVTSAILPIEKARRGEGPNKDLVEALFHALKEKGCSYEFNFWEGRGKELTQLIGSPHS